MIHLQYQVAEFFVEEEGQAEKKIQKIQTKRFPACFSKTGLKTTVSPVEESCHKLYND